MYGGAQGRLPLRKNLNIKTIMLSYCVKQRTKCVPGSETHVVTKNGRNAMKCTFAECGITKFTFVPVAQSARRASGEHWQEGDALLQLIELLM